LKTDIFWVRGVVRELELISEFDKFLLSKLNDGIIILTSALEIQYINPSAKEMLNLRSECLGQRIGALKIRKEVKEWLSQGGSAPASYPPLSFTTDANHKVIARISEYQNSSEVLLVVLSPAISTNNQNQSTDASQLAKREEVRREFLGILAHDLRSPLHKIMLSTEVLRGPKVTEEKRDHFFGVIERSSKAMLELLNDILGLIRIEAGELVMSPEQVELAPFLKDVIQSQREFADQHSVQLELMLGGIESFTFDQKRIKQVLSNLIGNALKFAPADSKVKIAVSNPDNGMRLEVIDTGPGVDLELQKRLFKPFSKGENQPQSKIGSTGLGLAICKQIVELHGGEIGVQSDGKSGSTFWFELPRR